MDLHARLRGYIDVRSEWFEVRARAFVEGVGVGVTALVHRAADGRVEVVRWLP